MKELIKIIVGLLFIIIALFLLTYSSWLSAFVSLIQGGIIVMLFLVALGFILIGFTELKE